MTTTTARAPRSVNIELVSRALFLQNIASVAALRIKANKLESELPSILAIGNMKKTIAACVAVDDAKSEVQNRIGMVNRHFRKAIRAFQIHNGESATVEYFQKMAGIFPDVPQNDTEKLGEYWNVLGEDQDKE